MQRLARLICWKGCIPLQTTWKLSLVKEPVPLLPPSSRREMLPPAVNQADVLLSATLPQIHGTSTLYVSPLPPPPGGEADTTTQNALINGFSDYETETSSPSKAQPVRQASVGRPETCTPPPLNPYNSQGENSPAMAQPVDSSPMPK